MNISFECFPPKTPEGLKTLLVHTKELATLSPDYFSVTFGAGGSTRTQTPETVLAIHNTTHINTIPHISCVGSTKAELTQLLTEYQQNGVRDLVVLRGDKASGVPYAGDFNYAAELVCFIKESFGNTFQLTVGAYPETHPESTNLETELFYFKEKVLAGANRAITQYFYNVDSYFYFCDRLADMNIDIPIIPGIMPIVNYEKLKRFSHFCGAEIPQWIRKQCDAYENTPDLQRFGFEVVFDLCQSLLSGGAPGLHFYTLNLAKPSLELCEALKSL